MKWFSFSAIPQPPRGGAMPDTHSARTASPPMRLDRAAGKRSGNRRLLLLPLLISNIVNTRFMAECHSLQPFTTSVADGPAFRIAPTCGSSVQNFRASASDRSRDMSSHRSRFRPDRFGVSLSVCRNHPSIRRRHALSGIFRNSLIAASVLCRNKDSASAPRSERGRGSNGKIGG